MAIENNYTSKRIENFTKKFAPYKLPNTLIEFIKFTDKYDDRDIAKSFYLIDKEKDFFETWFDNSLTGKEKKDEYEKSMIVFANADNTGGEYALWIEDGNQDLENAPIINYGSDGDITIVAENLKGLLKILSFGASGTNGQYYHYFDYDEDNDAYNYYNEFIEINSNFLIFRKWLQESLNIEPISIELLESNEEDESDEVDIIVGNAQKKYKESFDKWQYQFYPNWELEEKLERVRRREIYKITKEKLLEEIAKNPTTKGYLELATCQFILDYDDIDEEVQDERVMFLEKALELDSNNIKILEDLVDSFGDENIERSILLYKKLISLNPYPAKYYFELASVYDYSGEFEKGLAYFIKFLIENKQKDVKNIQERIVDICDELGKDPILVLEDTLKYGDNKATLIALYRLYFNKNDFPKASQYVLKSMKERGLSGYNYTKIADRFFKKELYVEVLPIYKKILDIKNFKYRVLNLHFCCKVLHHKK